MRAYLRVFNRLWKAIFLVWICILTKMFDVW